MKKKIFYFFSMLFILLIVLRASYAYYIKFMVKKIVISLKLNV